MKCNKKLKEGIKVEMEHAHLFPKNLQKSMAERIAKDHLKENCNYYIELKKMEKKLKGGT